MIFYASDSNFYISYNGADSVKTIIYLKGDIIMDPFTIGSIVLGAASLALSTAKGMRDDKQNKQFMADQISKSVKEVISSKQRYRKLGK